MGRYLIGCALVGMGVAGLIHAESTAIAVFSLGFAALGFVFVWAGLRSVD